MIYIYTQFYPKSICYLKDFINSINKENIPQTDNVKLIINFNQLKKKNIQELFKLKIPYKIYYTNQNQHLSRIKVLKKISKNEFKILIFIDSDDLFYKNRIMGIVKNMKSYDFLVNNLILFPRKQKKIFFNLKDKKKIKLNDIFDKNFIGLSNLAISKKVLIKSLNFKINKNLKAFDWVFAKIILLNKFRGVFCRNIYTLYRQHNHNVVSFRKNSLEFLKIIEEKILHYKIFKKKIKKYKNEIKKLQILKKKLNNKKIKVKITYLYKKNEKNFWWVLPKFNI